MREAPRPPSSSAPIPPTTISTCSATSADRACPSGPATRTAPSAPASPRDAPYARPRDLVTPKARRRPRRPRRRRPLRHHRHRPRPPRPRRARGRRRRHAPARRAPPASSGSSCGAGRARCCSRCGADRSSGPWRVAVAGYQALFFMGTARTGVAVGTLISLAIAPFLAGVLGWLLREGAPGWVWAVSTVDRRAGRRPARVGEPVDGRPGRHAVRRGRGRLLRGLHRPRRAARARRHPAERGAGRVLLDRRRAAAAGRARRPAGGSRSTGWSSCCGSAWRPRPAATCCSGSACASSSPATSRRSTSSSRPSPRSSACSSWASPSGSAGWIGCLLVIGALALLGVAENRRPAREQEEVAA